MDAKYSLFHLFLLVLFFLTKCSLQKTLDAKQYLYNYGYLTSMDHVDEQVMERATMKFQKSIGIPQTGKLDIKTKTMMLLPRCGMLSTESGIIQKNSQDIWKKNHLTFKIRNWTNSFSETQIKKVLTSVIQLWTKDVNMVINESSTDVSDLSVYFTEIDGQENRIGYANFPEDGGIYLDAAEDLASEPGSSCKIFAGWLLAHELGHALGLSHSNIITSVMYPMYNTETFGPSMMDHNNLVALYGGKASLNNDMICQKMTVDAMLYFNNKHILIQGQHYWTFTEQGLESGPFWLPELLPYDKLPDHFDAGFSNGELIFMFSDNTFYKFLSRRFLKRKIIGKGFDGMPSNMDAVLYEATKGIIHAFKGSKYYMFDMKKQLGKRLVVDGKNISQYWPGIPEELEAATMLDSNKAFFIKKSKSYVFDMDSKTVTQREDFFKCSNHD